MDRNAICRARHHYQNHRTDKLMRKKVIIAILATLQAVLIAGYFLDPPMRKTAARLLPAGPFTEDTKLSSQDVQALGQDSLNTLWIGTGDGLNIACGNSFIQLFHDDSDSTTIPDNNILCIHRDRRGTMWIGTQNGVAKYLGGYKFKTYRLPSDINAVHQITDTEDSAVLVNNSKEVYKIQGDRLAPFHEFADPNICNYLFSDRQGGFWATTPNVIIHYDSSHRPFFTRREPHKLNLSYYHLHNDTLWLSQGQNISAISLTTGKVLYRNKEKLPILPSDIVVQDDGTVLVNSAYHGLYRLDTRHSKLNKVEGIDGLLKHKDVTITVFFEDNAHRTVVGYQNGGFQILPPLDVDNNSLKQLTALLRGQSAGRLQRVGTTLLAATEYGMAAYDMRKETLRQYFYYDTFNDSPVFRQTVNDIVPYGNGDKAWIVTNVRIFSCRVKDGNVSLGSRIFGNDNVGPLLGSGLRVGSDLFVTSDSRYLLRCPFGAVLPDSIPVPSPFYDSKTKMAALPNGDVLLVMRGLRTAILRPASGKIMMDATSDDISTSDLTPSCVTVGRHGEIWIGTTHRGLYQWDRERHTMRRVADFPVRDIVAMTMTPDGRIAVASQAHLMTYTPKTKSLHFNSPVGSMTDDDRQQHPIVHDLCLVGSNIVFSCSEGCGTASLVPRRGNRPKLKVTSIKVRERDGRWYVMDGIGDDRHLTLPHGTRDIVITMTDANGNDNQHFLYQSRMSNTGDAWHASDKLDDYRFSDIGSGTYTLNVRVVDSPYQQPLDEKTLLITVRPPFAASWAALFFYALCLVMAIVVANTLYLRSKARHLTMTELQHEHERDKRTNEMNMSFFTNISHEFRNPLTVIAGPLATLRTDASIPETQRKMINMVCKSVNRMLKLIDQMLDFNQLEADVLRLRVTQTDISEDFAAVAEECRQSAVLRGIDLVIRDKQENLYGWLDKDKFGKIMANLLTNALKHCPDNGTITLSLSETHNAADVVPIYKTASTGRSVVVRVTNSGKAIPEDKIDDVFKRYYQIKDGNDVRQYGWGSGIGLYFVRRMVMLHHGFIHAFNNSDGSGVTFEFLLPIDADAYQSEERAQDDRRPMLIPTNDVPETDDRVEETLDSVNKAGGKPKMLIIDDDMPVAQYIRSLFIKDYVVVNKYDGETALDYLEANTPDIILTDIVMGEMNGLELCKRIKGNVMLSHIPVILITAKSNVDEQIQGLHLGAVAYVTKPFDPRYLQALVESQLANAMELRRALSTASQVPANGQLAEQDRKFLNELYRLMGKHLAEQDLNVSALCRDFLISRSKFNYKLKELTGETPGSLFRNFKLNKAAEMLRDGKHNVSEVAMLTGFGSVSYFSVAFKKQFGISPSEYK